MEKSSKRREEKKKDEKEKREEEKRMIQPWVKKGERRTEKRKRRKKMKKRKKDQLIFIRSDIVFDRQCNAVSLSNHETSKTYVQKMTLRGGVLADQMGLGSN